jgi:two-component system sensor histidine kinase UhpB
LLWRVFAVNAFVLAAATAILVASPATVSFPVALTEALVLLVGLGAVLTVNFLLLRRLLDPLARLTRVMRTVDPLRPGSRVPVEAPAAEIAELGSAFNDMLGRIEAERRDSARRALAAEEAERRRISRELHDEVGQALTGAMLELDAAVRAGDPAGVARAREEVRMSLEELREIARRLRPESLDDLGLASALRGLIVRMFRGRQLAVGREIEPGLPRLSEEEELVVYRVTQEALANVTRHAGATRVEVRLRRAAAGIELLVQDDGGGFDERKVGAGAGIRGMRERAVLIGAELSVDSAPGAGTTVRLRLPGEAR